MYLLIILSILIVIITLIITIFVILFSRKSKLEKYNLSNLKSNSIPKILIQTYKNKNKVPQKVFENIKKFASDYEYRFFEDQDCINFIKTPWTLKLFNLIL